MHDVKKTACQFKEIKITHQDLPLACPGPDVTLWNAHPKIYLPIEISKPIACPYCGTQYILLEE